MNRIEFMARLERLLQDISIEERVEALQYYNDYFDDAGADQEESIIRELGSPEKVAAEVKAGLKGEEHHTAEYRETGYADTRFEQKEQVVNYTEEAKKEGAYEYTYADICPEEKAENEKHTKKVLKYLLIGAAVLIGIPIILPLALGLVAALFGILIAIIAVIMAGVIVLAVLVVVGIALVIAGISTMVTHAASGLALIGIGLIVGTIGLALTVAAGYVTVKLIPAFFKWVVSLGKKLVDKGRRCL